MNSIMHLELQAWAQNQIFKVLQKTSGKGPVHRNDILEKGHHDNKSTWALPAGSL